jgi:hypothetical protein
MAPGTKRNHFMLLSQEDKSQDRLKCTVSRI